MTETTTEPTPQHTEKQARDEHWPAYYEVTAERPAWTTTKAAAEAFAKHPTDGPRFAVDLGCGAGRDARELLRRGATMIETHNVELMLESG